MTSRDGKRIMKFAKILMRDYHKDWFQENDLGEFAELKQFIAVTSPKSYLSDKRTIRFILKDKERIDMLKACLKLFKNDI